jgi:hypothetical protein
MVTDSDGKREGGRERGSVNPISVLLFDRSENKRNIVD